MSRLDFTSHAHEWIAAWNAHDLERILTHYAEDVELESPLLARLTGRSEVLVRGKPALREYFARGLNAFPALRFDLIRVYPGARSCVLEYRSINGFRSAETMEYNEHGKVRRVLAHYAADQPGGEPG
jgi:hypothetical protein